MWQFSPGNLVLGVTTAPSAATWKWRFFSSKHLWPLYLRTVLGGGINGKWALVMTDTSLIPLQLP